jgi:cytochrome bd-type quinol oxidase subunit 2
MTRNFERGIFLAAYLTLGVMAWPYMIPYSVTVANAAFSQTVARTLVT